MGSLYKHRAFSDEHGIQKRKINDRYRSRVFKIISDSLMDTFWKDNNILELDSELEKAHRKRKSPYDFADKLIVK